MYRSIFVLTLGLCSIVEAKQSCESLTALALPGVTITSSSSVPSGMFSVPSAPASRGPVNVPAFCRVAGVAMPEVKFEVWMPLAWNRKLLAVGNGGLAGTINYAAMLSPLERGYATASTDTGHTADTDGHWAQGHMQRVIDFAHRGVHVMTEASKAIIGAYYSDPAAHSYFSGCSQGGQEALTEAQRYPHDFDGIIAGDPANFWTHLYIGGHLWITQAMQKEAYIPATKIQVIADAVNNACDALDGIKDGVLNDPRRCHFDPATLLCKSGDGPSCLTRPQVDAVKKIYQGARNAEGEQIFPGIMPGGESGPGGWSNWITGTDPGRNGGHTSLGMPFLKFVGFENPDWDFRTFRFDRTQGFDSDVDFIDDKLGPIFNNVNPDLRGFQANGGKLIQYHGWSDPDISPLNSINYYQSVVQFVDGKSGRGLGETKNFYRLFMVPGMQHCNGGPGPNSFDTVSSLERWVEHGVAPAQMTASHLTNGAVDRTRPLCPYPQEAQWTGNGSTDRAENFVCALPAVP